MPNMTKGQTEARITEMFIKFLKEYMGRGAIEGKTYIIKDMVIVRLKGVLTPAEEQLAKTVEGAELVKKTRMLLLEGAKELVSKAISDILECNVINMFSDICIKKGERFIVFTLDNDCEGNFLNRNLL